MKQNDYQSAISTLEPLQEEMEEFSELYYNLAISYEQIGKHARAKELAQQAIDIQPDIDYIQFISRLFRENEEYDRALKLLKVNKEKLEGNALAQLLVSLGYLHLKQDDPESATSVFSEALNLEEEVELPEEVYFTTAVLYKQSDQIEKAIPLFEEAISKDYNVMEATILLADCLLDQNELERAEIYLRELMDKEETDDRVKKRLAKVLFKQEKYREAETLIDELLKSQPNEISLIIIKGNIYRESGKHEEAVKVYDQILELEDENKAAIRGKALSLLELDQIDEANELFDKGQNL